MRSILDTCHCTGLLLPKERRVYLHAPIFDLDTPIGMCLDDFEKRPYERPSFIIDFLSCNSCGARYDAKDEGKDLKDLRVYDKSIRASDECASCPKCTSTVMNREYPFDKPNPFTDPREHPEGVFCGTCNTVLGVLPVDPKIIEEYDAQAPLKFFREIRGR